MKRKNKNMKIKLLSSLALACSLSCEAHAQTILSDNFNGNTINPSLWQVSTPFSDSSMTEANGFAVFENRGRILTANAMPTDIDITGSFEFTGNIHDHFSIVTRTDGSTSNPNGYFNDGITFGFEIQNDLGQTANNITISDFNYPANTGTVLVSTAYAMSLDTLYNFQITDNGSNLALYINNFTTPILTATDSSVYGDQIGLYNREGTGGGSSISAGSIVQLDYLNVQAVPEPSAVWLGFSGLTLFLVPRRFKNCMK
jgi:hypothetical protein